MSDPHTQRIRNASQDPDWRTPPALVQALERVFPQLDIDLAASKGAGVISFGGNDRPYLGPDHERPEWRDALQVAWHQLGPAQGFLNPPYSLAKIRELRQKIAAGHPHSSQVYASLEHEIRALRIESWAQKAYEESLQGFTTIGVFPYAPQTKWFRRYVLGHEPVDTYAGAVKWSGHAALDCWILAHRVTFLRPDGSAAANANVNSCIIHWGPNPGFQGPWVPSFRSWSYR